MVGEPLGGRALLNFSDSRKSRRKRRIFEKFSSHYLSIINLCDNYYISFRPRSFESVRGDRFEYLFGRKEGRKKAPVSLQPTFLTGRCETRASKETRQTVTREVAGSLYRSGRGGETGRPTERVSVAPASNRCLLSLAGNWTAACPLRARLPPCPFPSLFAATEISSMGKTSIYPKTWLRKIEFFLIRSTCFRRGSEND